MMRFERRLPSGVRRLFGLPRSRDGMLRDMDDEVRHHVELRVAEFLAQGMSEAEARAEALRRFGDTDEFRDYAARRAARQARVHGMHEWFDEWMQDIRFVGRQFRKHSAFAMLAVLTLAIGIGANTAIFTVVHRLLIAPQPYPDGNRLVMLTMTNDVGLGRGSPPRATATIAWRARARSLEMIGAVSVDAIAVQDRAEQDTIVAYVTSNYLRLLGLHPALGRDFTVDEERPGAAEVAMITYGLWQRRYAGRPDALGSTLRVAGRSRTIVGVTPPEMGVLMSSADAGAKIHEATPSIWVPSSLDSLDGAHVFGRLRAGVSAREASRELQAILESDPSIGASVGARPLCCARAWRAQDLLDPRQARTVQVLFGAVGVLLLIACANVANLLMSRAWTRRREFAVRIALGAGRSRLARLVLTESVALALLGGALGVGVAWQSLRIIIALRPPALENLAGVQVQMAVLLWSAGISVATGILFGAVPAMFASARGTGDVLRSETRTSSGDLASRRMRAGFTVLQIAMSLVLLTGAGLLVRSFVALQRMPLGFEPHALVSLDVLFPGSQVTRPERFAHEKTILEKLRALPGVKDAAVGTIPTEPYHAFDASLETYGDAAARPRSVTGGFGLTFMTPNYFRVSGMTLLEGRTPDSTRWTGSEPPVRVTDAAAPPEEIVVNRELARRLWPNGGAVGARLQTSRSRMGAIDYYRVVGVVDDVQIPGRATPEPVIYQMPLPVEVPLVARASGSPAAIVSAFRRAVTETDARSILQTVLIGDDYLDAALAPARFAMALLGAFSVVALILSAVGLYGVIAYSVSQRTREIGVRVALGANSASIGRLVVGDGFRLAAAGVVVGVIASIAATRALVSMLYGVGPLDPVTFGAIGLLVAGIALLASYVPARRASRIDPMEALRVE